MLSYQTLEECIDSIGNTRYFALSTKGAKGYSEIKYKKNDTFIFGPETRGLPDNILKSRIIKEVLRIPMYKDTRSLNLSNAVSIVIYEAWRQAQFS